VAFIVLATSLAPSLHFVGRRGWVATDCRCSDKGAAMVFQTLDPNRFAAIVYNDGAKVDELMWSFALAAHRHFRPARNETGGGLG
jgi:hypothetical protein